MSNDKLRNDKTSKERLEETAKKHNATIIPERDGYVRSSGPRRQYGACVENGILVYKEI